MFLRLFINLKNMLNQRTSLVKDNPGFRKLWVGYGFAVMADLMGFITLELYTYNITGSATVMATLAIARLVPMVIASPLAGLVADRFDRRRVLAAAYVGELCVFSTWIFWHDITAIYVLSFIEAAIYCFIQPSLAGTVAGLVEKDILLDANAFITTTWNLALVIGPALGGMVYAVVGIVPVFTLSAAFYVISIWGVLRVPAPSYNVVVEENKPHGIGDLVKGISYTFQNMPILTIVTTLSIGAMGSSAIHILEVIYVKEVLHGGDSGFGLLISVAGLGGLAGALMVRYFSKKVPVPLLYGLSQLTAGLLYLIYGNVQIYAVALVVVFIQMGAFIFTQVLSDTMLQREVRSDVLGRVYGVVGLGRNVGVLISASALTILVNVIGLIPVFNLAGLVIVVAAAFALNGLRPLYPAYRTTPTAVAAVAAAEAD